LQVEHYSALRPKLLQLVIGTQLRRKEVDHDILEVSHHPTIAGLSLNVENVVEFLLD